ncbi:MAG: ATP-binding protein, partial [Clostridiales bacterium]
LVYFNDSIFIENVLKDIFTISDKAKIKTYFSFLPNVINIKNKFVNIEYKLILEQNEEKKIMLMLTDITEKKKLEKKIESEQNILKMVVKAVVNNSDFNEIINDYKYFCTIKLDNILNSKKNVSEKTSEIFLNIHTFKGNFSQLDMDNTVNKLHNLESKLIELEKNTDVLNDEKLRKLLFYQNLNNWVNKDINILKNVLGENYFKSTNRIIITEENLNEIEDRILTMMSPKEYETFLPEIKLLRKKSFKNILVKYSNYVLQLANRQEKLIHNFEIEGSDFLIETNKYHNFVNSLVNVFRNAVVHGIELPDERLENGKSEYGTIKCTVKNNKNEIIIEISDDGKGLDIEKIKEQILKREYLNKNQLTNLSDKNIIEYIFTDKFTTQKKVNDLSGRGAGLTAVKSEIDILGGEISIETNLNKGTKFTFIIPHNRKDFSKELFIKNTILSLICEIENYFINTFNSKMLSINYDNLFSSNEIFSRENNVYINFKSIVNGRIIMSVNDSTAKKIIRANLIEKLDPSEEKELLFDALAECANVIIGKALEMSVGINNRVKISSPSIIAAKTAVEIKHVKADTKSINIVFKEGTISLTCIIATLFDI